MSSNVDCYYTEFEKNGWLWRLELLPANVTYYEGTDNTFVAFADDFILDNEIELETAYSDHPIGIASVPTMKLKFASDKMTSDMFERIIEGDPSRTWNIETDYTLLATNTWVLRSDFGSGTISATSDYFFIGVQRATNGHKEEFESGGQGNCEITVVCALAEFARIYSAEKFGLYFLDNATLGDDYLRKQGFIYETAFPSGINGLSTVINCFRSNEAVMANTAYINIRLLERMKEVAANFRLPKSIIRSIKFSHNHLKFYKQDCSVNTAVKGAAVGNLVASTIEDDALYIEQSLWWVLATILVDTSTDYAEAAHGLFIRSESSGSLIEGETVADMLNNTQAGWGGKAAYIIQDNKLVLRHGAILQEWGASPIAINFNDDMIEGSLSIATRVEAGSIRSATYNTDSSGSDDDSEFKYHIEGNLSESDFAARCMIHNNLRALDYDINWNNGGIGNTDVTPLDGTKRFQYSWRQAGYDLRKFYFVDTISGLSSGNTDHKIPMICHPDCEVTIDGTTFVGLTPNTYTMDNSHWKGTFLEMQRDLGLPNTLAKHIGLALSNPKRALIEGSIDLSVININDIGRTVRVTFDGDYSRYSYLHDSGHSYATGVILSVKSKVADRASEVKLLLLPQ